MAGNYRALIVDDEPLARRDLIAVLSGFEDIEIVAEADSVKEAMHQLDEKDPDLIFLDIQMPGESGFDLLPHIPQHIPVVFVTAFDEFAIRAFEVNALDYLMKPVSEDRIQQTLARIISGSGMAESQKEQLEPTDYLFVKLAHTYHFIQLSTIVMITAADDYSEVYFEKADRVLVLKSMKEWEARLPANNFIRIHRSTIINMEKVVKVEPWFNQSYKVYLVNQEEPVTMSRRYFAEIRKRMA